MAIITTAADIIVTHLLPDGTVVTPPIDDDVFVDWLETFQFEQGGRTEWRCSADNTLIYAAREPNATRVRHCPNGHRWEWTADSFDNASQSEIGGGWRQTA